MKRIVTVLCLLLPSAPAAGQDLDCVIQPRVVARVSSPARGVLEKIEVQRGDHVEVGQVLGRLENSVALAVVASARARAQAEASILQGEARLELGEWELERAKALQDREIVSVKEIQQVETARLVAELQLLAAREAQRQAELELRQAEAALSRRTIKSPIRGVVVEVLGSPGEFFDEQPIFELAEIDPLRVELFAPIRLLARIDVGMQARVLPDEPVGGDYAATVTVVDQLVDAASGTFGVRLEFPNPDYALPAGLSCKVRFPGINLPSTAAEP